MDSAACIAASLQSACRDLGYTVPSERDARYIIGLGLHDALAHVLPGVAPSEYPRVVDRYRHHFLLQDSGTALFPGVDEMMAELTGAGHLLAVATGKSRRGLDRARDARDSGGISCDGCADEAFPSRTRDAAPAAGGLTSLPASSTSTPRTICRWHAPRRCNGSRSPTARTTRPISSNTRRSRASAIASSFARGCGSMRRKP